MSEWIESHTSLPRHRKTKRLAKQLGISIPMAVGYLHMLWYYVADFAPGGSLEGHSVGDIANGCDWQEDPEEFVEALLVAEWLDRDGDTILVHDWQDYNRLYRQRQKNAEKQAAKRARDRDKAESNGDITVTSRATDRQTDKTERSARTRNSAPKKAEPVDNPTVANLVAQMREIPDWRDKPDDAEFVEVALQTYSPTQIKRTIGELAIRQASSHEYRELRKTLGNWLKRAAPEVQPPSHTPFRPPDEREPTEAERAESIARLREMTRGIGRVMA